MATTSKATKVRVLCDGVFGKADEVVELSGPDLKQAVAMGAVDPSPEAVAYAQSLAAAPVEPSTIEAPAVDQ